MNYYILDTLEDFNTCQEACYQAHIAIHNTEPYKSQTTKWTDVKQRETDSKYICPVCEHYDNSAGYTIEASSSDWFPIVTE